MKHLFMQYGITGFLMLVGGYIAGFGLATDTESILFGMIVWVLAPIWLVAYAVQRHLWEHEDAKKKEQE